MKSYILHGENQPESRRKLSEIIGLAAGEGWEIIKFDWNNIKNEDLYLAASTQSMLSFGHLITVENFFTNNKEFTQILEKLPRDESIGFCFWEGRQLTPATLKKLPRDFLVQEFKIPAVVFKFLDALSPQNSKYALQLFHNALVLDSADFLLFMASRHVRSLIWVKEDPQSYKAPDWLKRNLSRQADKFSCEQLRTLHAKFLELDRANKRSLLPENLASSLDIVLASI